MADTNEAQLLNDLLSDIAREDARLDAAHLEARVMDAVEASAWPPAATPPRFGATGVRMRWAIAAAVAIAVLVPAMFWMKRRRSVETVQLKVDSRAVRRESRSTARSRQVAVV